jgi:hypothetical protein
MDPDESVCASVINDIISRIERAQVEEATVVANVNIDIQNVCSSVLSDLLSKVELECGVKLAEEITQEADVLSWLRGYPTASPRPSAKEAEEKLKQASALSKKKPFAQKLCAVKGAASVLVTQANAGAARGAYAVLSINNALPHVPRFAAKLGHLRGVYSTMLRMAMHSIKKISDASDGVLYALLHSEAANPTVLDPAQVMKMAAADEVVAWLVRLFADGLSNEATCAIFSKLDNAKKIQVGCVCFHCSALLTL